MSELTPARRRDLRAQAHHLNPVVTIAGNGLTPAVLAEVERSLQAHELIKVRVQGAEREQREALMTELCEAVETSPVQHIGNVLVVWRARREEEKIERRKGSELEKGAERVAERSRSADGRSLGDKQGL